MLKINIKKTIKSATNYPHTLTHFCSITHMILHFACFFAFFFRLKYQAYTMTSLYVLFSLQKKKKTKEKAKTIEKEIEKKDGKRCVWNSKI